MCFIPLCFFMTTLFCVPIYASDLLEISITVPQTLPSLSDPKSLPTEISGTPSGVVGTQSQYQFTGEIFSYNGTLTSGNTYDLYFFTLTARKSVAMDIASTNSQYAVMLCTVNWDTGTVTPTGYGNLAGNSSAIVLNVPAGDYALYVFSNNNSVGNTYKVMYNSTNPPDATAYLNNTRTDLDVVTLYYGSSSTNANKIASNGVKPLASKITYSREDTWPIEGGQYWVNHIVEDGKLKNVYYCSSVTTSKGSSNNALIIELDVGTLWTYWQQVVMNNGQGGSDFTDLANLKTPRYFNSADLFYTHCLIYDLNTNKYIYLHSPYNLFIYHGSESVTYGSYSLI